MVSTEYIAILSIEPQITKYHCTSSVLGPKESYPAKSESE